ncbi:MAG: hypothetical protein BRC52_10355 [Cyanobacteria bacterium SW_5_48_44]|nr:MAG: hypothetical protein BRC52_10355 [Cyanobacteria bacterium SW_5_48_44]
MLDGIERLGNLGGLGKGFLCQLANLIAVLIFCHLDGMEIGENIWGDTRVHSQRFQLILGFF